MGGTEGGSSIGPSSCGDSAELAAAVLAVVVGSSDIWAINALWAERKEYLSVGLDVKLIELDNGNGENEGKRQLTAEKGRSCH